MYNEELYHYGVKGMKWGVRRKTINTTLTQNTPKLKDSNGDYIYKKGTVMGRYGKQKLDNVPMYLFTNEKDKQVYKKRMGGEEQKFVLKKTIKIPTETNQLIELYKYTKDKRVIQDPYYYWKENINQGGKIADGYFKHMTNLGYSALVDVRNSGIVSDDPIILLHPKKYLDEVK